MSVELDAGAGGALVATDQIGGEEYQLIKLTLGAAGAAVLASAGAGNVGTGVMRVTVADDDTNLAAIAALLATIDTDTGNIAGLLGTIDADTSGIITSVQLLDDTVFVDDTATHSTGATKGLGIMAAAAPTDAAVDANDIGMLAMTVGRALHVAQQGTVAVTQSGTWDEVGINDSGNSITVDWAGTAPPIGAGTEAAALRVTLATDSTGVVSVDDNGSSLTVDYATTGSGTATGALRVELPTNGTGVLATVGTVTTVTTVSTVSALGTGTTGPMKAEDVAHSTGDMGIPAWGVRQDTPNATFAASNDYHFLSTDMVGGIRTALYETDFAVLGTNHVKKYYTSAGAVTDGIVWSPAAGKRWYVTDLIVNVSAAATVTFEDDKAGGDEAIAKFEFAANSGIVHHFGTPWFSGEDAADLIVTTSAGNIYITCVGYEI